MYSALRLVLTPTATPASARPNVSCRWVWAVAMASAATR